MSIRVAEQMSARSLTRRFSTGELTPRDVAEQQLARIAEVDPTLHAMAFVAEGPALQAADAATERWRLGRPRGPMDGVPVTIKDSIRAEGMPWRHGTLPNADLPTDRTDAPPARALKEAGAVILGKTAMPDLGMMAAGVSSLYGVVRNPWKLSCNTSGSSAGAGASLAAGIGVAGIGTDIAGSVRLPAASNGLVGLKPTQGLIPHLAPSTMRSAGPMARTVDDAWDLLDVITRADPRDNWSLPALPDNRRDLGPAGVTGLRVGVLTDLGYGIPAEGPVIETVERAARVLRAAGAEVEVMAPLFDHDPYDPLDRVFQVRAAAEIAGHGHAGRLVHPAVREWSRPGATQSAVDHAADLAAIEAEQQRVTLATSVYDVVLSPVLPVVSFPAESVGLDEDRPLYHCGFTAWFNQTGQPAATLCYGLHQGHPVGVQIIGQRFADYRIMRLARWLEQNRPFELVFPTDPQE
ncbi:amidase family protein [Raineyella sp. LH-20]|uniref:amidase family protein n=1 Tax=Raineyella sp. LH-20 TaxID=3081204 RepID=UPI0029530173|nr:amidase family protein [Raineyella sp. LH-20]WOP17738.1 amidase family protein [Raineyella sp. LH-20]